tara:strand:- start:162 stop:611 length:450 start_codon:yes stop_codon:yes gene_type:complete
MARKESKKTWADDQTDDLKLPNAYLTRLKSQGLVYRWLRYTEGTDKQDRRLVSRFNEGWRLVKAEELPEWESPPTGTGKYAENIILGDLVLAVCPEEKAKDRQERNEARAEEMATAFRKNLMRTSDAKYPISDESKISSTGGRRVNFDA